MKRAENEEPSDLPNARRDYKAAAHPRASMVDLDLGKRLLQVLDPVFRDLGSLQVERLQLRHPDSVELVKKKRNPASIAQPGFTAYAT